jgi:hypothetical protein
LSCARQQAVSDSTTGLLGWLFVPVDWHEQGGSGVTVHRVVRKESDIAARADAAKAALLGMPIRYSIQSGET